MRTERVKRVLIAPLDWGLGHTTRCIPLVRYLQEMGHEVIVAGNDQQRSLLAGIFPRIETWKLPGYNIRYSASPYTLLFGLLSQAPRILRIIRKEHDWLEQQMEQYPVDGIISDNRYGIYHHNIPSVIMTHQLQVRTGMGSFPDTLVRRMHYRLLERFKEVWVPDLGGKDNLSGSLGHPINPPEHARYIGLLSQMRTEHDQPASGRNRGNRKTAYETWPDHIIPAPEGNYLLILLSGPEPQRSILSERLWKQALEHPGKTVFVEGNDMITARKDIPPHITYHKLLNTVSLQPLMAGAATIICRSGYSTLMDVLASGKKAILIPTPGQTEQEYLGTHLHRQGIFPSIPQRDFRLREALQQAEAFPYNRTGFAQSFKLYEPVLKEFVS